MLRAHQLLTALSECAQCEHEKTLSHVFSKPKAPLLCTERQPLDDLVRQFNAMLHFLHKCWQIAVVRFMANYERVIFHSHLSGNTNEMNEQKWSLSRGFATLLQAASRQWALAHIQTRLCNMTLNRFFFVAWACHTRRR